MANDIYICHLEDLINEAKDNPNFNLEAEVVALAQAMKEDAA